MWESELAFWCASNDTDQVQLLLSSARDVGVQVDLLEERGLVLRLAIQHDNADMLTALVEHFVDQVTTQCGLGTTEYNIRRHRARKAVALALESCEVSPAVSAVLERHRLLFWGIPPTPGPDR